MDKQRLVIAGVGLAIALVIGLGYLFGIQPQLGAVSAASDQAASIAASNQASQAALAKLKKDYANVDQFSGQLTALQRSIPSSPSLDAFLDDLHALAASTGETISGFNPGQAVAYVPPTAPASSAPAASSNSAGSSSSTPTPAPTVAAPTTPQAPQVATNPLINASNFTAVPVKIEVKGTTAGAIAFLGALQRGDRLVLVTGFTGGEDDATATGSAGAGAASGSAGGATYSIDGLVYVLTTAPHPAPTPAPSPSADSSTPTPSATPSAGRSTPTPTPTPSH